jgi:hypothetical protein
MLKISRTEPTNEGVMWKLEGRLVGPWVEELRRLAEESLAGSPGLALDISGVSFVDRKGEELLRELASREVRLEHASGFLSELLDGGRG